MEKEQADEEKAKQINFEKNLQYFTFSANKMKIKNNNVFKK